MFIERYSALFERGLGTNIGVKYMH